MVERVIGIDELRPKLGAVLDEIERDRGVVVITSRSRPKGVLIPYGEWIGMRTLLERSRKAWLREVVGRLRERASSAGLTEEDVRREVEAVRRARGD